MCYSVMQKKCFKRKERLFKKGFVDIFVQCGYCGQDGRRSNSCHDRGTSDLLPLLGAFQRTKDINMSSLILQGMSKRNDKDNE